MTSVFISYARHASALQAKALHEALKPNSFLDERDIEFGAHFPEAIADALLGSRVVVVFADEAYFRRWYCLWELRTALGPAAFAGQSVASLDAKALQHIVIALPDDDKRPAEIDRLPPALASGNWPRASDTRQLAELVKARLGAVPSPVSRLYVDVGQAADVIKRQLLDLAATPSPRSLAGVRKYPLTIPPPVRNFVGRSHDLWRVDFALSTLGATGGAAQTASIEAGGGFGKSTLAREYLHRLGAERFPGGIFWMNAEEPLDAQFHGVLRTLRDVPEFPDFQKARRDARKELEVALDAEAANAPMLWVVDNIPENGPPLGEYCPALGKVTLLTTSRRKLSILEEAFPLPIGVLDRASAVDLLAAEVGPTPPHPDCVLVVEWVGRLPVALVVLNASLRLKRLTIAELAAAARGHGGPAKPLDEELKALAARKASKGLPAGVEQAFGLSYDLLSPEAQRGARLLAHLAPAAIPFELVVQLDLSRNVRGELVEMSFIGEADPEGRGAQPAFPTFGTMHPVIADYLRGHAADGAAEVIQAVVAVASTLNDALSARDQWRVVLHCVPHAQHLIELTRLAESTVRIATETHALLANALSRAFAELGRREEALAIVQQAVAAFRSLAKARPDAFEPDLAVSLNSLSVRLSGLGRHEEALAAVENAIEIRRRLAKARPDAFEPALAASLNNLSNRLSDFGRREEALAAVEDAVEVYRRLAKAWPEAFEPELANSLTNLSLRLSGVGRHDEAAAAAQEAAEIRARHDSKRGPAQ